MMYLMLLIAFVVGFIVSWIIFGARKSNGRLYIIKNRSPEEPDVYRFEIDELENLSRHKKIIIAVKTIATD